MAQPPSQPPLPPPAGPRAELTAELCRKAAELLRGHGGALVIAGAPVGVVDLERMAAGGAQDRKEEVASITGNAIVDTRIFAEWLSEFVRDIARYAPGTAIELGAPPSSQAEARRLVAPGKKMPIATGLKVHGERGAAFRQSRPIHYDRQLGDLTLRALEQRAADIAEGEVPRDFFSPYTQALQKIAPKLDAIMIQRVLRDVLRTSPITQKMGVESLRLLSPLADAVETALADGFFMALQQLLRPAAPAFKDILVDPGAPAAHARQGADLAADVALAAELAAMPSTAFVAAPSVAALASTNAPLFGFLRALVARTLGVDLASGGGFAAAVYRRAALADARAQDVVNAAGRLVQTVQALRPPLPAPLVNSPLFAASEAAPQAAGAEPAGPPLTAAEAVAIAARIFDTDAPQLIASTKPPPAPQQAVRARILERGAALVEHEFLSLCDLVGQGEPALPDGPREEIAFAAKFLASLDLKTRAGLLKGLYQIATGDADQRARKIGYFLATQARAHLKPGTTLGPLRVAFTIFWRQVDAGTFKP